MVRLASAQVGDKVRTLGGIARDPDWLKVPEPWRPQPNSQYTVADTNVCECCGAAILVLAELPLVLQLSAEHSGIFEAGLKAEWFTTEGARFQ